MKHRIAGAFMFLASISNLFGETAAAARCLIQGVIIDQSRSPIASAKVTISGDDAGEQAVLSDERGAFLAAVNPGVYRVAFVSEGFASQVQELRAACGAQAPVEVTMQVAAHADVVTVEEAAGYRLLATTSATKTPTALGDIPQAISVVSKDLMQDQLMQSIADVVRYVPGITMTQGEGHRDAPVIRGNASTADFYVNGVRDDVQYMRDLYNLERVEALKGPNAMIFGRGGGGGVINRVTKEAAFTPVREVSIQGGTYGNKRISTDFGQALTKRLAFRLNGMYENSDSFRNYMNLERYGVAPTLTFNATDRTQLRLSYENFHDGRITDRGVPSYMGLPLVTHQSTFFGNPDASHSTADVNLGSATVEHQAAHFNIRNSTLFAAYDKFYQNVFPGAVSSNRSLVALNGYNNATQRMNVFNQTDVTFLAETFGIRHTLLAGAEVGRQSTDNFRSTAYFNGAATSINVPVANPTDRSTPVLFRQSTTDADNHAGNTVAATYMQDQIQFTRWLQFVGGLRFDNFRLNVFNNRTLENRRRYDNMWSPRAGLVLKPIQPMSVYLNYSVSYLPSAGDQFSSLDATTETLKPEKFINYEAGVKWDVRRYLTLTTAVYRLDRTNTRAVDPNNPARIVQTGSQRTNGYEAGINGSLTRAWNVAGGYAYQDAFISSATSAARLGAQVAQVPHHTFSLWNNYRFIPRLGAGLGIIHQANRFAAVDNTVVLPSFTRADAAVYYSLTERTRIQANMENLTGVRYFATANGNNNISPGTARTLRVALNLRF